MIKYCLECGEAIEITSPAMNAKKYCSIKCRLKHQKKHTRISIKKCAYCGKEYVATHTKHVSKFCSNKCAYHSKLDSNLRSVRKYQKSYVLPTSKSWLGNSNIHPHLRSNNWDDELKQIQNEFKRLRIKKLLKQ
jgi:endogenous inhibitor of DNA gyrase (YacG/DUF329 family)